MQSSVPVLYGRAAFQNKKKAQRFGKLFENMDLAFFLCVCALGLTSRANVCMNRVPELSAYDKE